MLFYYMSFIIVITLVLHDASLSKRNSDISRQKKLDRQDAIAASWILQSLLDIYNNNNLESLNG